MATPNRSPGLLGMLGLDLDPQEILRAQQRQRQTDALGLTANLGFTNPGVQGAANIGALLGANLARPEGLTDDQQRKVKAAKDAENRMSAWLRDNADKSEVDKAYQYQTFLAESAFQNGLADIGATVLADLDQQRRARQIQDAELAAAALRPDQARANLDQTRASTATMGGKNKLGVIYKYGETDPNKGAMAWIDNDGNAVLGDGTVIPLGEYTTARPERPDVWGRGGKGAGGVTPTEAGRIRQSQSSLVSRGRTMSEMRRLLDEMISTTGTPAGTGKSGAFVSWTDRWANDLSHIMAAISGGGEITAVGEDGKEYSLESSAGRKRLQKQYDSVIKDSLPSEFKQTAAQAEQYAALVSSLIFADARAHEGGGRQLSDNDIRAAAQRVGANVNNPETIRDILVGSYDRAYEHFNFELSQYDPLVRTSLVHADAIRHMEEQRRKVHEEWSRPFNLPAPTAPAPTRAAPSSPRGGTGRPRIISVEPVTKTYHD